MNVEEMREAIREYCANNMCGACLLDDKEQCYQDASDKEIEENYKIIMGIPLNFTPFDIKSGYLVRFANDELGLVVEIKDGLSIIDGKFNYITDLCEYNDDLEDDEEEDYDITEVYDFSKCASVLFDTEIRKLLYKREEVVDIRCKTYEIKSSDFNLKISPNDSCGYKYGDEQDYIFLEIQNDQENDNWTSLSTDSAKELINALQEIISYVEGEE